MYFVHFIMLLYFAIGLNSFQPNEEIVEERSITDQEKYHTNERQQEYKSRIAGGDFAYINDFPYIAYLFPTKCGATILSARWLLSIWDCNAPALTVLVGVDSIANRNSGDYKIILSYHHRKNNWDGEELFPLVLLKLDKALQFDDRIQPIAIGVEEDIQDGKLASITGFGATNVLMTLRPIGDKKIFLSMDFRKYNNEDLPRTQIFREQLKLTTAIVEFDKQIVTNDFLRSVKIPIATHETCIKNHAIFRSYLSGNRDRDFCAGYDSDITNLGGKHSFCEGDLGSGLVVGVGKDRRLVGVALKNQGCGSTDYPGIYASVPFATHFLARMDPEHEMIIPNATSYI